LRENQRGIASISVLSLISGILGRSKSLPRDYPSGNSGAREHQKEKD
jgi:hypothetical protein